MAGNLEYYNLQNGCGTPETYEFVIGEYVPMLGHPVEFMTLDELLEIAKEQDVIEKDKQEARTEFIELQTNIGW